MTEAGNINPKRRRRLARRAFSIASWIFAAGVLLQVYFAGLGILVSPTYFAWHESFGEMFASFLLALLVLGLVGRVGGGALGGVALLFTLFALQFAFIHGYQGAPRALHTVNAFALFWVAIQLARNPTSAPWGTGRTGRIVAGAGTVVIAGILLSGILRLFNPVEGASASMVDPETLAQVSPGEELNDLGSSVYADNCEVCHGSEGEGGLGPALANDSVASDPEAIIEQILRGGGGMPAFIGRLSSSQIAAVARYIRNAWGTGRLPPSNG